MKPGSIGLVETKYYHLKDELVLESGKTIKNATIAYETYGKLNGRKNNVILVCHALTGDAHAAGWHEGDTKPGWWDILIGPGKCIDTTRYFVVCSNVIGGCQGSTGPASINPKTGKKYALSFPVITIKDMVNAQKKLLEYLEIKHIYAAIGGSMGGLQVLQWSVSYPEMLDKSISIASSAYSSPQQIAFNEVGRIAITSDPEWNEGNYSKDKKPIHGLALARMIGHITYLSDESMRDKFGRELQDRKEYNYDISMDFQVESYLHYKGKSFAKRFDPNSYLYITKAVDYFDLTKNGSLSEGLKNIRSKCLIISVTSDWLYPPYQSKEILMAMNANNLDVTYREIESNYGHDAFLLESGQLSYIISGFLDDVTVSDIMKQNVVTVTENISLEDAAQSMFDNGITHLPVVSNHGKIRGIITSWDISKAVALKYTHLDKIITKNVLTASPDEKIDSAARKMQKNNISALPVIDEDEVVIGIIGSEEINKMIGEYHYS
ncbi:homoserine O-acetyltransferase MetX [Methanosalsum natronophilum]|nr:homoserine O-acetyltransferase [Methanosalsum natronophilum]MCS3924150.1 homoserine O-acetyltransferase [Methanosalsum natronophilum]